MSRYSGLSHEESTECAKTNCSAEKTLFLRRGGVIGGCGAGDLNQPGGSRLEHGRIRQLEQWNTSATDHISRPIYRKRSCK